MSNGLSPETLTLPKEKTYLFLVLLVSLVCWLALLISIVGILYALAFGVFLWFGHGLLIGHLRSEGVRVSEEQLPGLYHTFLEVASELGVRHVPELYILQSGGLLNAFATRFSGRDFVVLFSDMLEAHGEDSPRIRFILGHELGHIKRGHIVKQLFLLPGSLVPLLGAAYRRACEATCDRHGALACGNIDGGIEAMMALSGGKVAGLCMSPDSFARQHREHRGFFVSLHELTSGYPTLSQRVAQLISLRDGSPMVRGGRHPLAYFFAIFTAGGRGGGANVLVTVAIVAMLASLAVPAVAQAQKRAKEIQAQQKALHSQTIPGVPTSPNGSTGVR